MNSLIIALAAGGLYLLAYHTYGKFIAGKLFKLDDKHQCPSVTKRDNIDFVPSKKEVLFGHHFTSIAGTGPIVGPAIAIIWGWLPALLWIIFGSILMGAVHDFGSLVVSLRSQGRSIGDISGDLISRRVKILFLLIIFFVLTIVIAIFALIIGICFDMYPHSVWPVWLQIPIAVALGFLVYKKGMNAFVLGIIAVVLMYATIIFGAAHPLRMPAIGIKARPVQMAAAKKAVPTSQAAVAKAVQANRTAKKLPTATPQAIGWQTILTPAAAWVVLLLIYVYIASILPVQTLLQPRDYINSYQLIIAMSLLGLGIVVAHPAMVAPATRLTVEGAPPLLPVLFITVACGAISGFHSLVSSGTSSKQCAHESDSLFIGYGSMLIEGMLAVFVLIACGAGIGIGLDKIGADAAFNTHYINWTAASGLGAKLGAFITGARQLIHSLGIPAGVAETIMGVFIVSFAATTLDSATRIQRYIVGELALLCKIPVLSGKHPATMISVGAAFILAFLDSSGKGALALWPLFGGLNQLLAGLALLVITVYLAKHRVNIIYTLLPMLFMIVVTGWAMLYTVSHLYAQQRWHLVAIGGLILLFELWIIIEAAVTLIKVYRPSAK